MGVGGKNRNLPKECVKRASSLSFFFIFYFYLFTYLAVPGLSWGIWDL